MSYLLGVVALVLGWGVFQFHKRGVAESSLDDLKFKGQLNDLKNQVVLNDNALKSEEDKRAAISDTAAKEEKKDITNEEVLDFLNNTPKS